MMKGSAFVITLGSLVLVACQAIAPDSRMSEVASKVPVRWTATKEAKAGVDQAWVSRFDDRALNALIEEGLRNNADLQIAAERVAQAKENARLAGVSLKPTANATLDGIRQERQFIGFPGSTPGGGGGSEAFDSFDAGVNVSWEIDLWGRVRANQAAEIAEWKAVDEDFRSARSSFAGQVAKSWFVLAEANEQLKLAERSLDIRQKTEEAIKTRYDLALDQEGGTAAQFRLAQSDTESAKATVEQWKGERERVLRELEVLVGRYPEGQNLSSRGLPKVPSRPPSGLPSGLLLRRPDILAAERRFAGSGKRLKEARLAVFPNLTLTGSVGRSSDSLGDLLKSENGVWSLGAGVLQPILTGGQIRYEKSKRESIERQRLSELEKAVLVAFGEVETALVADASLARRVEATAEASRLAEEAARSAENDFSGGTGDVLTLLEAQSREVNTASQLVTLRRAQLDNRVDLHLALGGDFRVNAK